MSGDLSAPQALHLFARWREAVEARGAARAAGDHELARTHAARVLALGDLIHAIPSAQLDTLTAEIEALTLERHRLAHELRLRQIQVDALADLTAELERQSDQRQDRYGLGLSAAALQLRAALAPLTPAQPAPEITLPLDPCCRICGGVRGEHRDGCGDLMRGEG